MGKFDVFLVHAELDVVQTLANLSAFVRKRAALVATVLSFKKLYVTIIAENVEDSVMRNLTVLVVTKEKVRSAHMGNQIMKSLRGLQLVAVV